jgi:hypothetical protein
MNGGANNIPGSQSPLPSIPFMFTNISSQKPTLDTLLAVMGVRDAAGDGWKTGEVSGVPRAHGITTRKERAARIKIRWA